MILKLLVDESLPGFRDPLQEIARRLPLEVEWLPAGRDVQTGRFHAVFLKAGHPALELSPHLGSRLLTAGGGPRTLPLVPDAASLEVILGLLVEARNRDQHVADSRALLADLGLMMRLTGLADKVDCVAATAMAVTRSEHGLVLLAAADGSLVCQGAETGAASEPLDPLSALVEVARDRASLVLPSEEVPYDPFFSRLGGANPPAHALAVSMVSEGRLIGLLVLCRLADQDAYADDDLGQALIIGSAAAIAIDNLRLYREAREAYDRLVATQKQLLQVEKLSSLGQLSAGIAHEINNPLFVIMGNLELAIEKTEAKPKGYLQKALANAERIKKIVMDLREFYAPSKNVFAELDINSILENAIPIVSLQTTATRARFKLELAADLPPVLGDDNQLLQVFTNIVLNAIQAMPEGGEVCLSTYAEGEHVIVSVRDTGVGIPPEHLDRVFDPFFTTKRDWTGTGLGLSVSHTIVDNHRGKIEVESELARGTTFRIRFPAAQRRASKPEKAAATLEVALPPDLKHLAVLVVDDDEMIREFIQTMLSDNGLDSDCAGDAVEALRMSADKSYDLIFLDNKMPGRSGLETLGDLRHQSPGAKVVLLTGQVGFQEDEVRRLGFWGLLRKPSSRAEILDVVRRVAIGGA